jgi:hypothetical protein
LLGTCHEKTYITVVNNGSHPDVRHYLDGLLSAEKIHEVIHTENIGKINAVIKGIAGHDIELVTIADADVMFLSGWQFATQSVFRAFPKAGVVGLVPQYKTFAVHCDNLIFDRFFSKSLRFVPVKDQAGQFRFYKSLGWKAPHPLHSRLALAIGSGEEEAFVGSGHFVATYKRDIFDRTALYFDFLLGGTTESHIDALCLLKDYWRLTTIGNFAYHLGNIHEDWMDEVVFEKDRASRFAGGFPASPRIGRFTYFMKNRVFRKIFRYKRVKRIFYRLKNMPTEMVNTY